MFLTINIIYLLDLNVTNIAIPTRKPTGNNKTFTAKPGQNNRPPRKVPTNYPATEDSSVVGPDHLAGLRDVEVPNKHRGGYVLTYVDSLGLWTPQPLPILRTVYISISITGVMNSGEVLMQYAIPEAVAIPAGGAFGSFAIASIAASGYVTATINKNKQQVGTIVWGPSDYSGTINLPSTLHLTSGDVLQLVAPVHTDTTLANIGVTFACVRGG